MLFRQALLAPRFLDRCCTKNRPLAARSQRIAAGPFRTRNLRWGSVRFWDVAGFGSTAAMGGFC